MTAVLIGVVVLGPLVAMVALTLVGQRRRGHGLMLAILAGMFFPVTWIIWYIRDERPYRLAHRH